MTWYEWVASESRAVTDISVGFTMKETGHRDHNIVHIHGILKGSQGEKKLFQGVLSFELEQGKT